MIYKLETLKNRLSILTSDMPHMESISMGFWVGVGSRYEKKRNSGISHLAEHMLFKGTKTRTALQLKETIEGVGGSFNGFTAEDLTCYLVKLPAKHVESGFEVLSDMVLNPAFDPVELEKEKFVICEEIKMYRDRPGQYIFDILEEVMWPDHPLGMPIIGYTETVNSIKQEDLLEFKNRFYNPSNLSIVVCGKVDNKKILQLAKEKFSSYPDVCKPKYRKFTASSNAKKIKIHYREAEQSHLAFGFYTIPRRHKHRYTLLLLNVILGANMSSRLFERLRERMGLCYEISSGIKNYDEIGALIIHAGVDNNKVCDASKEILEELCNIKKKGITADELERAKEYCKGQLILAMEDTASRMLWLGERILREGKAPSVKEVFGYIDKVKLGDIKNLAKFVFDEKRMNFACIGPVGAGEKNILKTAIIL